jgi:hypothetical protein
MTPDCMNWAGDSSEGGAKFFEICVTRQVPAAGRDRRTPRRSRPDQTADPLKSLSIGNGRELPERGRTRRHPTQPVLDPGPPPGLFPTANAGRFLIPNRNNPPNSETFMRSLARPSTSSRKPNIFHAYQKSSCHTVSEESSSNVIHVTGVTSVAIGYGIGLVC